MSLREYPLAHLVATKGDEMRRSVLSILSLCFVSVGMARTAVADTTIGVYPSTVMATSGETISLDINVSNISDLYAYQFDVTFTPGVLSGINVTEGAFLSSAGTTFFIPGTIDNSTGTISFNADTLIGAISGASGSGTLAVVEFEALSSGTSPVELANVMLFDSTGTAIVPDATDQSTVTVEGVTAVPEPESGQLIAIALLALITGRMRFGRR